MNSSSTATLLEVTDLQISSSLGDIRRVITSGVDLNLAAGETLGIVGESGSGKSMTARAIMGLLPAGIAAHGEVQYRGRDLLGASEREMSSIRGQEIGMIFQDPFTMLNPLMRCGDHIVEMLRDEDGKRLRRRARRAEAARRLAEVGIDDASVVDTYPFQLSGGMRQRVGIAAALARDPQLVIADEPSTALDVTTQAEILAGLKQIQAARGMGLILITHDLRVAFSICDRIQVLYAGSVLERGVAKKIEDAPRHPYTLGLLMSDPPGDRRLASLKAIPGSVPEPDDVVGCCAFSKRCDWRQDVCDSAAPSLVLLEDGGETACVRIGEITEQMCAHRSTASAGILPTSGPELVASDPIVTVRDLEKVFGTHKGRVVRALDRVSIEVGRDESVGLVGESGSGKTTLGRCLLGLERPTAGSIVIDGVDANDYNRLSSVDRRKLRRTVQMVFQDPSSTLNPVRTVGATLREALLVTDPRLKNVRAEVARLLARVGLPTDYAERKPVALSGGERQRVAIARALAPQPQLIVCDEAVSALDVSVQAQILNLLADVRADLGVSFLFITHDLAVVRQIADRVYVLRGGELVEQGPTANVLDDPKHSYTQRLVASVPNSNGTWLTAGEQR